MLFRPLFPTSLFLLCLGNDGPLSVGVHAQLAGASNFAPIGAAASSPAISWQSVHSASSVIGPNQQSPITNPLILPVIGASSISSVSNTTLTNFINTQNFLQALVGSSSSASVNLTATQVSTYVQQLVGLASNNATATTVLMNGLSSFFQQIIGGANATTAQSTFTSIVNQVAGLSGTNSTAVIATTQMIQQLIGALTSTTSLTNNATLPAIVSAYSAYVTSLVGLSGAGSSINNTIPAQAYTNYVASLIGLQNASANTFTSLNNMVSQAIGTSSVGGSSYPPSFSDPSFESYSAQLASNTGYGGTSFLGQGLASQTPWNYGFIGTGSAGGFQVAVSGLNWGTVINAQSGNAFAIFQQACYAQQRITGLIPGQYYTVSWYEQNRLPNWGYNDFNVAFDNFVIYSEANIGYSSWTLKTSAPFVATSTSHVLRLFSNNTGGGDRSVFIDSVTVSSASKTVNTLANLVTFIKSSIGASNALNSSALINIANTFNGYIVQQIGFSNISSIANYIQSVIGATNASTVTVSYIQTAFPGLSNGTSLINYINANPGTSNATAANWINFLYTNCGPANTTSIIQFNALIQQIIGSSNSSSTFNSFTNLLQAIAGTTSAVNLAQYNSNLNLLSQFVLQMKNYQPPIPQNFASIISMQYIYNLNRNSFMGQSSIKFFVFYYGGNWLAKDVSLINNLTTSIGNSPWFNLLFEYQNLGSPISSITIAGQISIASASSTYWLGNALDYSSTTTNPANILINVLKSSPTWQPCFNVGGSTNTNGGTASGYLILTSDDITVNNIGNTAGVTLGTNVYGYHTVATYTFGTQILPMYYGLVGKPSLQNLVITSASPNIINSPNNNPQADFVILILGHELAEMYTNSNMTGSYSGIYSNGGLLEAADQCAGTNYGGSTYCVGTQTLASTTNCPNGVYYANTQIGSQLYLLPSLWSIKSQQCLHQPLVPQALVCNAIPVTSRVTCSDSDTATSATICQSLGCCWDSTQSTCFHSDSQNVVPATCPFFPHANRIDCGLTNQAACNAAGCCWHNSSAGAIAGASCYRQDVLKQRTWSSTNTVKPYIPYSSRIGVRTDSPYYKSEMDCHQYMSNAIWNPVAGHGLNNHCYLNTYSPTGFGYTYKTTAGSLVYCSGVTTTSSTPMGAFTNPDSCLAAGGCWQPTSNSYTSNQLMSNMYPDQTLGCFAGAVGSSIGPAVNQASPVAAGTSFYLTDTAGNVVSLDSLGNVVLGTAGSPLILQSKPSANTVTLSGSWTTFYSPLQSSYLSAANGFSLLVLGSLSSFAESFVILQAPGSTSYYIATASEGCYLSWDYTNNVGVCANSLSTATSWKFNTAINSFSAWSSLGCYMDSARRTINTVSMSSSTLTSQQCVSWCLNQGYTVAGIEVGTECYCSNTLNGAERAPNQSDCPSGLGAGWRLNVYTANPNLNRWVNYGCWIDNSNRILNAFAMYANDGNSLATQSNPNFSNGWVGNGMTIEYCQNICAIKGYSYAGIEVGTECHCGNSIVNGGAIDTNQGSCSYTCSGNNNQICGGGWRITIYSTVKPANNLDARGYCSVCSNYGNAAMFSGDSTGTLNSNSSTNNPVSGNSVLLTNGVNLVMQNDGNMVLYTNTAHTSPIFSSATWSGVNGFKAMMQTDGNFVIYNQNNAAVFNTWTSPYTPGVAGSTGLSCLAVMPEGDMAIYKSSNCNQAVWQASKGSGMTGSFPVFNPNCGASYCSYWMGSTIAY